jgi:hypothetical protein
LRYHGNFATLEVLLASGNAASVLERFDGLGKGERVGKLLGLGERETGVGRRRMRKRR